MKSFCDHYICVGSVLVVCLLYQLAGPLIAQDSYEWNRGKWVPLAQPSEDTPPGELVQIRQYFAIAKYKKVVKSAGKFRARYPDSAACEEICLLAGRAEIARKRYYQAYGWFEKQLNQFPAGRYSARALEFEYEIAEKFLAGAKRIVLWFIKLSAKDEALDILVRIAEHAPGSQIAAKSVMRMADYHYRQKQWVEAIEAYDMFGELFPKSAQCSRAMLQAARASYSSFGGIEFEDTPILDAEQRFKTFAESYPAAAKTAGVEQTLAQIARIRAHKLYETGQLYERTGHLKAAAFYYQQAIDQYPQTQWSQTARSALRLLGGVIPQKPTLLTKARVGGDRSARRFPDTQPTSKGNARK